jgi:formylglycine-generating enzyme required for sulfatase activity
VLTELAALDPAEKAGRERESARRKREDDKGGPDQFLGPVLARVQEALNEAKIAIPDSWLKGLDWGKDRWWLDLVKARAPSAGETRTIQLPGGVPMTFAWCPPGSFRMGSNHPEAAVGFANWVCKDERPVHKVTLTRGFFMGIHPVTRGQFARFVAETGYMTEAEKGKGGYKWDGSEWQPDPNCHWRNPGFEQTDQHPVTVVNGNDAKAFATWLQTVLRTVSKRTVTCQLPTEAEWEYACRAGTTTEYHFGQVIDPNRANYRATDSWNSSPMGEPRNGTTEVGSFPANEWGLFDMHGNVWEWCATAYGAYPSEEPTDPLPGHLRLPHVLRGGSWFAHPVECRAASRTSSPLDQYPHDSAGFRVCFRLD